jgi:hypothetical protein
MGSVEVVVIATSPIVRAGAVAPGRSMVDSPKRNPGGNVAVDLWRYRESMAHRSGDVDISGWEVLAKDGAIGTVDKSSNQVSASYIVVATGEWLSGRLVLLPAYAVERIDGSTRQLVLDRTKDEVRDAPDVDPKGMRSARSQDLLTGYYHGLYDTGL